MVVIYNSRIFGIILKQKHTLSLIPGLDPYGIISGYLIRGLATTEAARRYWSFYELACLSPPFGGISPNLCNFFMQFDTKYFSHLNNFLTYDYKLLMNLMEKSINYPIKTDFEKKSTKAFVTFSRR